MSSLYGPATEDVKQRLRPFGIFFEKSLKDLIKGIRAHNETPEGLDRFLDEAISECRREVNSLDMTLKTNAVLKLTYLEMYGYDMSWANFHIMEVMSSTKLQQKRVGYLAASQSFHKDTDILVLSTNLIKKDLKYDANAKDVAKIGIAISGLSNLITPTLAADICDDLFSMLNSSRSYIRKKAITALFKIFLQYPETLRDNFDKFASKLEETDTSVLSATITVICELCKQNPEPFVPLSPLLYEILVTIDNNWIIIRLLKLFTNLSQFEPKLRPKLLPKVLELMESTTATSVIYESVNCIVKGKLLAREDYDTAIQCLEQLYIFCESPDPNLRYISCVLFYKVGKINTNFVKQFDVLVIRLLTDIDVSIRSKAVELLKGIVDDENLQTIVSTLMKQFVSQDSTVISSGNLRKNFTVFVPEPYKIKIVHTILELCSDDNYSNIADFGWYNSVLYDLAIVSMDLSDINLGYKIGEQLKYIMVKVPDMRDVTMETIVRIISNDDINKDLPSILKECYWALGEYASFIENSNDLIALLIKRGSSYSHDVQRVLIVTMSKVLASWCGTPNVSRAEVMETIRSLIKFLEPLYYSKYFALQEVSVEALEFLKLCLESFTENGMDDGTIPLLLTDVLPSLFNSYELRPVLQGTQRKIQNTISIDLTTPFISDEELKQLLNSTEPYEENIFEDTILQEEEEEDDDKESEVIKEERYEEHRKPTNHHKTALSHEGDPFYLGSEDEEPVMSSKKDLLDMDGEYNDSSLSTIRLARGEDNERKPKQKNKKNKIKVLVDETVVGSDFESTQPIRLESNLSRTKPQSKLATFKFRSNENVTTDDIELLKKQLEKQDLNDTDIDEVVIVKKKKKKKKKKSTKTKKKDPEIEQ